MQNLGGKQSVLWAIGKWSMKQGQKANETENQKILT